MRKLRIALLILVTVLFSSCNLTKTIEREVPVETIKIQHVVDHTKDSIYVRDSVYMHIYNDTVYKYKERERVRLITQSDTIVRIDSIPYPVRITETKTVNKQHWWQIALQFLGGLFIICFILKLKKLLDGN